MSSKPQLPILYSLQHCPYAMRARLAILLARQNVQIRALTLKNKPAEMLLASAKRPGLHCCLGTHKFINPDAAFLRFAYPGFVYTELLP